jgi:hypothetical protein
MPGDLGHRMARFVQVDQLLLGNHKPHPLYKRDFVPTTLLGLQPGLSGNESLLGNLLR